MKLIKNQFVPGDGFQAPGNIVLRQREEEPSYMVHFQNLQSGGYFDGHYLSTEQEAENCFSAMVKCYAGNNAA
jgi:hypothetical protein